MQPHRPKNVMPAIDFEMCILQIFVGVMSRVGTQDAPLYSEAASFRYLAIFHLYPWNLDLVPSLSCLYASSTTSPIISKREFSYSEALKHEIFQFLTKQDLHTHVADCTTLPQYFQPRPNYWPHTFIGIPPKTEFGTVLE